MKIRINDHCYWNLKVLFRNLFALILIVFCVWAVVSYGEILCKNVHPNPEYSPYNLWTMFLKE